MSEPRLGSEVSVSNEPNLTPGDSGQDVTDLQQRLHDLGYFDESIDGQYGDTTEQAVRRYQQDRRLDQTGSVDEHTWGDIAQHERDQQYAQLQANTGADGTGQGPHLSEDGRWQWDGDQWQPAGGALLADNSPVGAAQQAGPASQPQAAQQATMQMSPDGQWWWDGANWQPTAANSRKRVFVPSATMAVTRQARDALPPVARTMSGSGAMLLMTTKSAKIAANHGTSGGLSAASTVADRVAMPTQRMTGSSMTTRDSFTMVATFPASGENAKPAPTTCATSWMVAPMKMPAWALSKPASRAIAG